jgi:hypothetical protein
MKRVARFLVETLGLFVLGAGMLLGVILAAKQIADEKLRYFVIGYYVAIHHDLVLRIWKNWASRKLP